MSETLVWRAALERLRREISSGQFETWLRGTRLSAAPDGTLNLHVRSTFAREMLQKRYHDLIESAVAEAAGRPCSVRVVVSSATAEEQAPRPRAQVAAAPAAWAHETLFAEPEPPAGEAAAPVATRTPPGTQRYGLRTRGTLRQRRASLGQARPMPSEDVAGAAAEPVRNEAAAMGIWEPALDDDALDALPEAGEEETPPTPPGATTAGSDTSAGLPPPRLNRRYTFDTFIVGSGNKFAHAASQAVAEVPGQSYNPLFLYGGVGLGKTHLLHAIGHTALAANRAVLYVSSETFTNEIINAIRFRATEEFRAKYRSVDVLLVDDIQFIAGKESTEEEFFHTFNTLYDNSKQIVICSDRPPKAILSLEERLRSRFEWGLIADIQPPDLETRVAILRTKADHLGRSVPDEVIGYLASRVQSNIRELEGSLNRLLAFSQHHELPLSMETAKAAMASLTPDRQERTVGIEQVVAAVAEYYRLSADDLRGKQRDKHIVVPRQIAMYLMRQETQASLLEIGQALGGRDHSTVLHGAEKIARAVNEHSPLRKEVQAIRQQLLG